MFEQKLLTHLAEGELQKRGRKGFREIACRNHHETNREWNSLSKRFSCRYTNGRLHSLPLQRLSFVGQGSSLEALPPCLETSEPLGTGVDAHTAPLCGARANDLNRHLKSLRNKRKKHGESSAKRAREKDRCRKKVNT